jgi:hypothetical protein
VNIRNFSGKIIFFLVLFIAGAFCSVPAKESDRAEQLTRRFFLMVYRKEYQKAYNCFSNSVKQDVDFEDFKRGSKDVRYLKILSIKTLDEEDNLIKMRIEALMHLVYKGQLYEALYTGNVDTYKENGNWKVITIDLEAKSQKPLGKKSNGKSLQKLDFGTKKQGDK